MRQGMFEVADLPRLVEALAIGIEIDREFAAQCRVRNIPLNVAMTAPLLYMTHIPAPASANEWTQ